MKLFNRDKIILDLCGGSGAWSQYYKKAGYDVRLITSPGRDVTDYVPPIKKYNNRNDVMTPEQIILCKENRKPQDCGTDKKAKRAITPAGFAKAFFEANP